MRLIARGVATMIRRGGGGRIATGVGRIQLSQNHLPQNSDFYSDFTHFILEISENLKIVASVQKIFFKNRYFWGDIPEFRTGGKRPRHPPRGWPMLITILP